jgi:regulator of protease activity HflC (stomatin/prohibitin superfamily)
MEIRSKILSVIGSLVATALVLLALNGCKQVDPGERGLLVRFGEIQGNPLPEGLYFYNPFTTKMVTMDTREQKITDTAMSFTRDTQRVDVAYAITFFPQQDKIDRMFKEFGYNWQDKIVPQVIQGSIKDIVGGYVADDLVGKREEARISAQNEITKALAARNVVVTRLDFVNLDFDDAYEKAVEAKVVAIQKAAESKNRTVEVEENAKQKTIGAEAEAKSMQIRSRALSENQKLVEYEAVQKWDGKLPTTMMGSSTPFINLHMNGGK